MKLLTREEFKQAVFERDKHKCVCCDRAAVDAHHIMERKLFPDGGYVLENGASLCERCHLFAEETSISAATIRSAIGAAPVLPPGFSAGIEYDKWGNAIVGDKRTPGPLFNDDGFQTLYRKHYWLRLLFQ